MAVLIHGDRIVPVWLEAARHLAQCADNVERNIVLEIASPGVLNALDRDVIGAVDEALKTQLPGLSVQTVASTIFPNHLYKLDKRPAFYESYLNAMSKGKKKGTWGTYALRMIRRVARNGTTTYNPLETLVRKLQASKEGRCFQAVYELGLVDVELDLQDDGFGFELPLYDPALDRNLTLNMPCLSHLSFKVTKGKLDLTALYRSHWYCQRALGNLIGLNNLFNFVATESGFERGVLTCLSTHAYLDTQSFGGAQATKKLLESFDK